MPLTVLLASLLLNGAHPAAAHATTDTSSARTDAGAEKAADAPATLTFDFGNGAGLPISTRAVEFELTGNASTSARDRGTASARVKVVRSPDSLSAVLAKRVGSGDAIPSLVIRLQGAGDTPALLLRLHDVQVVSTRLVLGGDTLALAQQRLSLDESIAQLTADLAEARRQHEVVESLEKQRLSASLEVARMRGNVDALTRRLAAQEERRALLLLQLARWSPVQEELVLSASKADVEPVSPTGH